MNSHIFNRLGRALLRPLLWRQLQRGSRHKLTRIMFNAMYWFFAVLTRGSRRQIPLNRTTSDCSVVLYLDAQGNAYVASVVVNPSPRLFIRGRIPHKVRKLDPSRQTNIVAYELPIAVASLMCFCLELVKETVIQHSVDSMAAIACMVKSFCKEQIFFRHSRSIVA